MSAASLLRLHPSPPPSLRLSRGDGEDALRCAIPTPFSGSEMCDIHTIHTLFFWSDLVLSLRAEGPPDDGSR